MKETKENKMGTTPVFRLIVSMSLPSMFSMLVQSLYNIVDSMFVAQLGEEALTSVSLAFPVQTLLIAIAVGTGIGINSLVSRRLGEGKRDEANSAATHGIFLGVISGIVFAVLGVLFTDTFFSSFTDNQNVIAMGSSYIHIITLCSMAVLVEINIEKTLQATGNMVYPMIFMLVGSITNLILDPIMIFGLFGFPKLGVAGAAIATVIGQILSMLYSIYVALTKSHEVHIKIKGFKFNSQTVKNIYAVGFPSIIMQSIGSLLVVGLNAILITFSEAAVSVLGVYYKLQSFVFMPVFGLTHGVLPIIGYNFGARNKDRMMSALKIGCLIALAIMTVGMLLFMILPDKLLAIFNASESMLTIGIPALRIISICFIPAAIGIIFSTLFQAVGMGNRSLFISVMRQLVVILPAAYVLSKLGLGYVWLAFPIAEIVSLVLSLIIFNRLYKSSIRDLKPLKLS